MAQTFTNLPALRQTDADPGTHERLVLTMKKLTLIALIILASVWSTPPTFFIAT